MGMGTDVGMGFGGGGTGIEVIQSGDGDRFCGDDWGWE